MKTHLSGLILVSLFWAMTAFGQTTPTKVSDHVRDYVHILTQDAATNLNRELASFQNTANVDIVVVVPASLGGKSPESYATDIGIAWHVGSMNDDRGVVFLVAPTEKKVWIKTTIPARNILSDDAATSIARTDVSPLYKTDKSAAVVAGTHAIMHAFQPQARASSTPQAGTSYVVIPVEPIGAESQKPAAPVESNGSARVEDGIPAWVWGAISIACFVAMVGAFYLGAAKRQQAREIKAVISRQAPISRRIANLTTKAAEPWVDNETRVRLTSATKKFEKIRALKADQSRVDWSTKAALAEEIDGELDIVSGRIEKIDQARKDVPRMMTSVAARIDGAEKRFEKGKVPAESRRLLAQARQDYEETEADYSASNLMNWLILHDALMSLDNRCAEAERMYASANQEPRHESHSYRSSAPESSSGILSGSSAMPQADSPPIEFKTPDPRPAWEPSPSPPSFDTSVGGGGGGGEL